MSAWPVNILWRRLDVEGGDAARLDRVGHRFSLSGVSAFVHQGEPAALAYAVEMASTGAALSGSVRGFVGRKVVDQSLVLRNGDWLLNGRPQGMNGLVDLDLGFTPATNWQQLRRAELAVGQEARFTVAWLDAGAERMDRLEQAYRRTGELTYDYDSPSLGYRETLTMMPSGFVADYPGLWRVVTTGRPLAADPRSETPDEGVPP